MENLLGRSNAKISKKSTQDPPKSRLVASKIEPGALQDAIFKKRYLKKALGRLEPSGLVAKIPNLAPSWRPKRLPNRGQGAKKSMLKTNTFLASIFEGFGPCFGRVFNRFFGPKIHAKSNLGKIV